MQLSPRYEGPAILSIDGPPQAALEPTVRQRRRFAETLAGLTDEQWASPSRCEGWTVQDVVAHLATVNSFWELSVQSGLSGTPTRFLAAFDPAATPAGMVDGMRALSPADVLDQFVTSNDGFLAAIADLDDVGWTTVAEAPPGHLPISRLTDHALWDCWVHERDVALPLGLTPVVEPDEVVACLRYAAALSPAFALSTDDAVPDVYAVVATEPDVAFVIEVGTSVSVRMGPAPDGAPLLEGPGVDLLEALSMRTPLPASSPAEWQVMLGGLASAFDLEVERPVRREPGPVTGVPVIDVSALRVGSSGAATAAAIDAACRDTGFFSIVGHGVPLELRQRLDALAREFFALPDEQKARIAMPLGGRAWRGWFPVEGELTSGIPDLKEGIYFGQELASTDRRVLAGVPLHGPNLFPDEPAGLGPAVLEYLDAVTEVGHLVLRGIALGLGLDAGWFDAHLTARPLVLFRIFHYPPPRDPLVGDDRWGVAEHTDYGLVTVLGQDQSGGLEVRSRDGWVPVPPDPDAFVVNIGDMLERMTGGAYRSTPHRVRNTSGADRLSFPLFLDPDWDAEVLPVPSVRPVRSDRSAPDDGSDRWDGRSVLEWSGTYGDYLLDKVGRVFPDLRDRVIDE